jgi:hypothetical protein
MVAVAGLATAEPASAAALPANATSSTAAQAAVAPQDVIYSTQTRVVNKTAGGYANGNWKTCFHLALSSTPTTPACSESVTASTAIQVSGGFSDGELSSSFGFQVTVTHTYTVGWSLGASVPAHKAGNLQVGTYYRVWTGGMEIRTCHTPGPICGSWSSPTSVRVEQYISTAGRFVYTSN